MFQMPDMAQEKNVIARIDLLHHIGNQHSCGIAQDRQAMAIEKQVTQCLVPFSCEMKGMRAHMM